MQPRPYQTANNEAVLAEYDKGVRRMLSVMATGTGKTNTFGWLIEQMKSRLPGQTLVLSHTEELVKQTAKRMQEMYPEKKVGIEMSGLYAPTDSDIISGSVATLGRAGSGEKRLGAFNVNSIDKIIVDEAHHTPNEAYSRILAWSGCLNAGSDKLLLGVTATPRRSDDVGLSDIFEKIAFVYSIRQAIEDGWLVGIRGYRVETATQLASVETAGGDYIKSQLSVAVDTDVRNRQIVSAWLKQAEQRKTMAFCVDIQHAKDLADEFNKQGVSAVAVWGDDPERAEKTKAHREGKIKVLCNCAVFLEGYDDPDIACVVLARPTISPVLFAQMVGRGTRLAEGKVDLIVLDVVDATVNNSLMTVPTLMGLSNTLDTKGKDLLWVAQQIETAQEEHPGFDFSKVKDIEELPTLIKSVDMFEVRFPKEVEENSELTWFRALGGGYKMLIPKELKDETAGAVHIWQNLLGQWELKGKINGEEFHGRRSSVEEAFKVCDEQIRKRLLYSKTLECLKREATWHNKKITKGQRQLLERLFPKRHFDWDMITSGQASRIISDRLARKVK